MSQLTSQLGAIITFYSYKGGTGRSMAVANVACLLAKSVLKQSQKILVMDWDLEAPGLHRYFTATAEQADVSRLGVINYFHDLRQLLDETQYLYREVSAPEGWKVLDKTLPIESY